MDGNMIVKDIMTSKLITADSNETIQDACNKYRDHKVGCLLVIDNGKIVGIVTGRDFIEITICMDKLPKTTKIREIMTPNIKTIHALDKIEKALETIKTHKIKKLPVISNNRLVGIVTITDIAYTRPGIIEFLEIRKS